MPEPPREIVASVERAAHLVGRHLARELDALRLTQAEAHVLARLGVADASPNELHRLFGHRRSTLTSVLDRLEARGFATRAIHPDDRRSFLISLTPAGREAAAAVREAVARLERRVAERTSARDRSGFAAVLEALDEILGDEK